MITCRNCKQPFEERRGQSRICPACIISGRRHLIGNYKVIDCPCDENGTPVYPIGASFITIDVRESLRHNGFPDGTKFLYRSQHVRVVRNNRIYTSSGKPVYFKNAERLS